MNRLKLMKIVAGVALILSMAAYILPLLSFDDIHISMYDLLSMSADVTELMEDFGASSQLIEEEMSSYFVFCIIMLVFPVLECLAVFLLKGKIAFVTGFAGVLVNNVLFFIFYDKIHDTISLINEAIAFWGIDMQIETMAGTIALWVVCYVAVAGTCACGLLANEPRKPKIGEFRPIREILPEEITPASSSFNENHTMVDKPQPQGKVAVHKSASPALTRQAFCGGLIGRSGIYKGKIRLFSQQEVLLIGTDESTNDVLLNTIFDGITYCELFYNDEDHEYYLRPQCVRGVFLKSGQPLGKDRVYCLPRGTVFTIRDKNNEFELA